MKKIFCFLLILIITHIAFATETGWYYIYIQTEYSQGPWNRVNLFEKSGNHTYLEARPFMDLFGSDSKEMVTTIFNRIKKEDEKIYIFKATISVIGDTVVIETPNAIDSFDAVKNELVATFTLNSFAAVKIIQRNKVAIYKLEDITVPYMDLVMPKQKRQ